MGTYLVPHNEPSSFIPPVHCFTTHTHTSPVLPCQELSPLDHTVGHVPKQINEFSLQAHNGPTQIFVSPHNLAMTQTTPCFLPIHTILQPFANLLQSFNLYQPSHHLSQQLLTLLPSSVRHTLHYSNRHTAQSLVHLIIS